MRIGILGAGPAAGAAALCLARGDFDVTVFTADRPAEKPCGGALPAFLLDQLEGFDASSLPSIGSPPALLENASGQTVRVQLPELRIYRRGDLDPALLAASASAGAVVVRAKARRLDATARRVAVETDAGVYDFDWLIGADGACSLSRRCLGLPAGRASIGMGASLDGVEIDTLALGFPDLADAYLWAFPRPSGCSVGIAYSATRLSNGAARGALREFASRHLPGPLEQFGGPRYRYPIPVFSGDTWRAARLASSRRVLLVGDAAGVADPLTREGIRYAVRSGRLAAECLIEAEPEDYPRRLNDSLKAEMSRADRAAELFFDDPIGQWMVPVCRSHPGVRRVLGDLLGCRQPYWGLRSRLLRSAFQLSAVETHTP